MGTRSQTLFIETYKDPKTGKKKTEKIAAIYRQMDGYPEGHGTDLADFLKDGQLVNGISLNETKKIFNGMGCLTAQVIAHLKDGPGSIYVQNPKTELGGEEYLYEIEGDFDTKEMILRCFEVNYNSKKEKSVKGKKLFEGHPKDFEVFVNKYKEA